MDCFTHVHKREPGKHIRCWWELYISCIWICRLTEKVFRNVSKNEKVSTVPTLPDVQQFPTPGVPPSGYACSYRACTPKIQRLCLLMVGEVPVPHKPCSAAWTFF